MTGKKFPLMREITILDSFTHQTPDGYARACQEDVHVFQYCRRLLSATESSRWFFNKNHHACYIPLCKSAKLVGRISLNRNDGQKLATMQQLADQPVETMQTSIKLRRP